VKRKPLVFFHGLGIGLASYLSFVLKLDKRYACACVHAVCVRACSVCACSVCA